MPALAPATPLPREPRALWWKGGQWIWRLAVYSCSLSLDFLASVFGGRRRAPVRLASPANKDPPDPSQARPCLASPGADLVVVCSGLAGKVAASANPWAFVLRIRRRRGRVSSDSACGSGSFCRSFVAGVGFACAGARVTWCLGARFVARGGGSGVAPSTCSTGAAGFVAELARGIPRSTRHSGCASLVAAGTFFDSQSQLLAMVRPRLLGLLVARGLLRRPLAAAGRGLVVGGRKILQGLVCNFSFLEGSFCFCSRSPVSSRAFSRFLRLYHLGLYVW